MKKYIFMLYIMVFLSSCCVFSLCVVPLFLCTSSTQHFNEMLAVQIYKH